MYNSNYYSETAFAEQNRPISNLPSIREPLNNPHTPTNIIQDDDDEIFTNLNIDGLDANVSANRSTHVNQFLDDDDDIFLEANIPDAPFTLPTVSNEMLNQEAFDDMDDIDLSGIESKIQSEIQHEEQRKASRNNVKEMPTQSVAENIEYFDPDWDAIFPDELEDDFGKTSDEIIDRNYEFMIGGFPLATILQLHSIDDNDKSERSFIVKCEIFKTVEQIRIVSNRYQLVVLIKDSSDLQLEVIWYFDH